MLLLLLCLEIQAACAVRYSSTAAIPPYPASVLAMAVPRSRAHAASVAAKPREHFAEQQRAVLDLARLSVSLHRTIHSVYTPYHSNGTDYRTQVYSTILSPSTRCMYQVQYRQRPRLSDLVPALDYGLPEYNVYTCIVCYYS